MSSPDQYFDHNATTPLSEPARAAWMEAAQRFWHNPSSLYPDAAAAKRRLEDAREQLAELVGVEDPAEIVFTSGTTEANNAVIAHYARAHPKARCAVSAIEHPSVLAPARRHFGDRLDEIRVSPEGIVDLGHLEELLEGGDYALVSVMAANNETGALQPIDEIAAICRRHEVPLHCDAAQSIGKTGAMPDADLVVGSGHKFGGPRGVGFLRIAGGAGDLELQTGGPQEERRRAGTEDLPGIAAMVTALDAVEDIASQAEHRDAFEAKLLAQLPGALIASAAVARLPNTSMLIPPSGKNLTWLTRLGRRGFSISTGSACSSGAENGSHVLAAMGLGAEAIGRALRISSGASTPAAAWEALAEAMLELAQELGDGGRRATLDLRALGGDAGA